MWVVGGCSSNSIRLATFTSDLPLRLNVTTLMSTPGKRPNGVVTTSDDSVLFASTVDLQEILTVLNPLSSSPTLGPILNVAVSLLQKLTLHPGCQNILLIGCGGHALVVYNMTSQSTIRSIDTLDGQWTFGGAILPNGTVVFGGYSSSPLALVSWCCLSPYNSSILPFYAPSVSAVALPASFSLTRDFVHDTRSDGLFSSHSTAGIQYLSLNPVSSTVIYNFTLSLSLAMVDFVHCSGPIYGILIAPPNRSQDVLPAAHFSCCWCPTNWGYRHRRCW